MRPGKRRTLPDTPGGKLLDLIETAKAHIRAKGKHLFRVAKATFAKATSQGPVCEIRLLTEHRYEPGIRKRGGTPCTIEHLGRRGQPVKKMRLIPAEKAFALARKLQGTRQLHHLGLLSLPAQSRPCGVPGQLPGRGRPR